jgi:hypothetical protein
MQLAASPHVTHNATAHSARLVRAGQVISGVTVLFLLFDSVIHIAGIASVAESLRDLGFPVGAALGIGLLELACLALYVVPRTSILGAILLTGYLGGAVAAHVRIGSPVFSTLLFPVYVGVLLWAGLYLRDSRVRSLVVA